MEIIKQKKYLIIIGIVIICVIVAGFWGFTKFTSNNSNTSTSDSRANNRFNNGNLPNGQRMRPTSLSGLVNSITDNKIILDLDDNKGQRIITTDSNTVYSLAKTGSKSDLTIDKDVQVNIKKEGDNITAISIRYGEINNNPQGSNFPGGRNPNGSSFSFSFSGSRQSQNPEDFINRILNDTNPQIGGKIKSIDQDKLVISVFNSQDLTINISSSTFYTNIIKASNTDLKQNSKIQATGIDANSNFSARNIVIEK